MPDFNRMTGLMIIEATNANINGDPDRDSDPRVFDADGRACVSPVSIKRKVRDLIEDRKGALYAAADMALGLSGKSNQFEILESRGRDRKSIAAMSVDKFKAAFWDGRLFGNTFLEASEAAQADQFKRAGVVQIGLGMSIAPVEIERFTTTNKSGVQEGKDRGMAPLSWRGVRHAVYTVPIHVNPMMAASTGCTLDDIELLKFVLPFAYSATTSTTRAGVELLHLHWIEHKHSLGSVRDGELIDALRPVRVGAPNEPSTSLSDYDVPTALPGRLQERVAKAEDLMASAFGRLAA